MSIISLDLSTKSTGFAIFDEANLIDFGCITASSTDVIKRIQKITLELNKIFTNNSNIEKVIVEEVRPENNQYGVGNLHTHKVLMWLQASIAFMLHDQFPKVKIEYVYPNEWRAGCGIHTGRGIKREELKAADIKFAYDTYMVKVNDDIADAIGIGHAFVNKLDNEINWE